MRILLITVIFFTYFSNAVENKNFLIAIDPGHTKKHFGAVSSRGVTEYDFNIAIANVLLVKLQDHNKTDAFIINPDGGDISLKERTQLAKNRQADLYISLHHDSVQQKYISYWQYKGKKNHYSDKFEGYSIFISNKNVEKIDSLKFSKLLGKEFRSLGFVPTLHHAEKIKGENRKLLDKKLGIYSIDDLIVLKTASMPAILIECGVFVNRKEELLVAGDKFKEEFANAILLAILKYSIITVYPAKSSNHSNQKEADFHLLDSATPLKTHSLKKV
jgi:N-acetylmuramoyl-L-alanine amidase